MIELSQQLTLVRLVRALLWQLSLSTPATQCFVDDCICNSSPLSFLLRSEF